MIAFERVGAWSYRALLLLLPRHLRAQVQSELVSTFVAGQRHFRDSRGLSAILMFTLKELFGLVVMAVNARGRDSWKTPAPPPDGLFPSPPGASTPQYGVHVLQDIRSAVCNLVRRPATMLLAVVTVAVGIATSSAMFSVIDTVLLRPLPYTDSHELVTVYPTIPTWRGHATLNSSWNRGMFSYPEFVEWRGLQTSFDMGAVISTGAERLTGTGDPERIPIAGASWELFPMLGVSPMLGRLFTPRDDDRIGERVVILSASFWRRRFGADPSIVGAPFG